MIHKLIFELNTATALSVLRYLNNKKLSAMDNRRLNRFLTAFRGDLAELVINKSDALKLTIPKNKIR